MDRLSSNNNGSQAYRVPKKKIEQEQRSADLKQIERYKIFIDKLANGINPLTDTAIDEYNMINDIQLARCFFYVSNVLNKVLENGGVTVKYLPGPKKPFWIDKETLSKFPISKENITAKKMTARLNSLIDTNIMYRLSNIAITTFLSRDEQGKKMQIPFDPQTGIAYNCDIQKYIIDNMDKIMEINNELLSQKKYKTNSRLHNRPWTDTCDEMLVEMWQDGVSIVDMAIALNRSENSVKFRLNNLGFVSGE